MSKHTAMQNLEHAVSAFNGTPEAGSHLYEMAKDVVSASPAQGRMKWNKPDDHPEIKQKILILTDSDRTLEGYMNASTWAGESVVTYSYHGLYFDFTKLVYTYCLVNCRAWMPIPEKPMLLNEDN